ncbi:MAG TPA: zinc ribbon domain-containing protein [Nitrospirota bacterium]|nr:zinc ribbon domain-containing protein [Nitrospirota bacterium]
MLGMMRGQFKKIKSNLTSLDSQPLSRAALVIILFLDIFILVSIFDGLDKHTRQISSPDEYIPYSCRQIVIDREWNPTNRLDNLSGIILSFNNSYYPLDDKKRERHPVCKPYLELLDQIKNNKELIALFDDRGKFQKEAHELQRDITNLKGAYDTSLLETIARQKDGQANVDTIRKDIQAKTGALNTLRAQIESLEQKINENAKVLQLWDIVSRLKPADRETLKTELRALYFWYPVKKLGMQLIFLLPLFAVFYAWNNTSIRRSRGIQTLVSSHLLVVSFIPIFFKIIETIYDIIPKKLLKKFIDLLETFKLVALWNYLLIALAVAVALFLIYIFQKKLFSRAKLLERRITKGQCQECGKTLPAGSQACSFCGFVQFKTCDACSQPTLVYAKYCKACGKEQ